MKEVVSVLEKILTEIKDLRRDFKSEMDWTKKHSSMGQVLERLDAIQREASAKHSSMGQVLERLNEIQGEAFAIKSEVSAIERNTRD